MMRHRVRSTSPTRGKSRRGTWGRLARLVVGARPRALRAPRGPRGMVAMPKRHVVGFVFRMQLKQLELHMKTGAFADHLDMDRSMWYLLRTGQRELTLAVMKRVLEEWPEEFEPLLKEAVLGYRMPTKESLPEAC